MILEFFLLTLLFNSYFNDTCLYSNSWSIICSYLSIFCFTMRLLWLVLLYTAVGLALLSSLLDGAIRVGLALTYSSAWVSLQQHLVSMKVNEKISLLTCCLLAFLFFVFLLKKKDLTCIWRNREQISWCTIHSSNLRLFYTIR